MITLKEGLKLAMKLNACQGNFDAFKKALDEGNELECYQIALGNYEWLLDRRIVKYSDWEKLEKLAKGIGKSYHYNGQLEFICNYKNGERDGLFEKWNSEGQLHFHVNYKDGERDGLFEKWNDNGQLRLRENYKNGKRHGLHEEWNSEGQLKLSVNYENGKIVS